MTQRISDDRTFSRHLQAARSVLATRHSRVNGKRKQAAAAKRGPLTGRLSALAAVRKTAHH
jgi:hypothetical protein